MKIGEILVQRGLLTEEQLSTALTEQRERTGERLGETVVRLEYLNQEQVSRALADQMGVDFVDVRTAALDDEVLDRLPLKFILRHEVLPLSRNNGAVQVATSDPLDTETLDELRLLTGLKVNPVFGTREAIREVIRTRFGLGAEAVDRMATETFTGTTQVGGDDDEGDLELAQDAALIRFVDQILVEAAREGASDVHLEPFEGELRIRYRIDGILHPVPMPGQLQRFQAAVISRIKIMASLDIAEKRLPQDGRIDLRVDGREVDVRVSIIPMVHGEGVVLRLLDRSGLRLDMTELGMADDVRERFERLINLPHGILLVTGPTGSGKTTTLYSALSTINRDDCKIVTIEDPVEYELRGVNQIPVRQKVGLTFASGLRSILRHDPDVVMVGEIRDAQTADIAIQSALTGHLVLSTLHTNDAAGAVTRLLEMGVEPFLVASSVEGLMAQRLVRTVCSECAEDEPLDGDTVREALGPDVDLTSQKIGRGCKACRDTGYKGRTGLFELIPVDDRIRELVLERATSGQIKEYARSRGVRTLREDGVEVVRRGLSTLDEVVRVTKTDTFDWE